MTTGIKAGDDAEISMRKAIIYSNENQKEVGFKVHKSTNKVVGSVLIGERKSLSKKGFTFTPDIELTVELATKKDLILFHTHPGTPTHKCSMSPIDVIERFPNADYMIGCPSGEVCHFKLENLKQHTDDMKNWLQQQAIRYGTPEEELNQKGKELALRLFNPTCKMIKLD